MKNIFQHDGSFSIFDYSISHKKLLLRYSFIFDSKNYNIDVLFRSTRYLNIPTTMEGLNIYLPEENIQKNILDKIELYGDDTIKAFFLSSKMETYFIVARDLKINENDLDNMQTVF